MSLLVQFLLILTIPIFIALAIFGAKGSKERARQLTNPSDRRSFLQALFLGNLWKDGKLGDDGWALVCFLALLGIGVLLVVTSRAG